MIEYSTGVGAGSRGQKGATEGRLIELRNLKQAEEFLRGLGLHIDESVVRKIVLTIRKEIPGSIGDLHKHGKRKNGTQRNPVCGHGTVTKIQKLMKNNDLDLYLAFLDAMKETGGQTERPPSVARSEGHGQPNALQATDDIKQAVREWLGQLWIPEVRDLPEEIGDAGRHESWIVGRPYCWIVPGTIVIEPYPFPADAEVQCPIELDDRFAGVRRYIQDQSICNLYDEWKFFGGRYLKDGIEFRFEERLFYANPDGVLDDQKISRLRSQLEQVQQELVGKLNAILAQ